MTTLELLQLQNEHKKDNFFEKGEDAKKVKTQHRNRKKNKTMRKDKGAFNIRETKTALVINKTQIHEYDGTAIYNLHIPPKLAYIWKTCIFGGGGVIRGMTVSDIKKFFYDNHEFAAPGFFNIVQDINHMSDIYIVDITK